MSQKPEKPPDPAHEAKLAARREKHGARVWAANPRTQELQRKCDAALHQLQILRDGTFCRQYQQMQQWCKQVEGEREAMEQQLMRVEGERTKMHIFAVVERAAGKTAEEAASKAEDKVWQERSAREDLEYEVKGLKEEVAELKQAASRRRGSSPEPEKKVEENPVVLLCQQHAEDNAEITVKLAKMDKTLQGVVAALGFVANANERAAKSKSSGAASSCGQKRKRDGRGGDRKSGLYLLQCRMGQIPLAEACKK